LSDLSSLCYLKRKMIDPEFALVVGIVGAVGAIAGANALEIGRKAGDMLDTSDMAPMRPPYPPLPRFLWTKPEVLEVVMKSGGSEGER